jgi:TolB protein
MFHTLSSPESVTQTSSLQSRRIPFCGTWRNLEHWEKSGALPSVTRRYSRVELCATNLGRPRSRALASWFLLAVLIVAGWNVSASTPAPVIELRPVVAQTNGVLAVEYHSGGRLVCRTVASAPAGVELRRLGASASPVLFRAHTVREGIIELGPASLGGLTLRFRLEQKTPSLVERTLVVSANTAQRFSISFPIEVEWEGEFASFSGPAKARTLYDTVRGSARTETFPVVMVRRPGEVVGLVADSPGLWENRCQVLLDPPGRRLAVLTGDGRDPYPLIIKPPEDARDTYQYQMDGWQWLAAGETRRFTTWVFISPARTHYDAQVAAHLAVANGKGWNSSVVEAILRNTSLFLLRRNLALDADHQPRDGRYIFISGPGYGWKQWVSDGFYTALGLDDPEKTIESNRAVFWTRMDYEDNAQYYLIWAVLMKRAGGTNNDALVRRAYDFIRRHEKGGLYIPPPLPGAPNSKGWKTYHDVLPYDDDDSPASDQGFHCGALLAAKELGLGGTDTDIGQAIAAYRSLFNSERGFMPTSRKLRDTLGQDTLYGATLTYAVFGRKLLGDEQIMAHFRTSEKVKTPYGLRVISQADGSLLPGHSGVYCYGGSWFLNDAANYLLAGVHGLPAAEVDALLVERIAREIAQVPAFNESISTVDGHPHGHILYSWNSGYWWLRRQIRQRLGQTGPDPVDAGINARLGVVRTNGVLRLDPERKMAGAFPSQALGYTELRTDLPGGRHANVRTMRAVVVKADGSGRRPVEEELVDSPDVWTQFAGWSPDGERAIICRGWQSPENARWEEEHKTFRMEPGRWLLDSYLLDMATGKLTNVTGVERVSHYNGGLFFLPQGRGLGFTPLINGVSKPFVMDLDGRHKRDVSGQAGGFAYGYSASPDGQWISYHEDYQIFIAKAGGSGKKRIETGNPFNFGPQWSGDGQWLLFVSGVHGQSNPYVVRRDGTGLRRLADLGGYQGWILFLDVADFHQGSSDVPVWAADGRSVFYTARVGKNVELLQVALDGRPEQLTKSPDGTLHYHPRPSPDGRWLVYGSKRDGVRQLFLMRLADRFEMRLTDLKPGHAAMWPHWQPLGTGSRPTE